MPLNLIYCRNDLDSFKRLAQRTDSEVRHAGVSHFGSGQLLHASPKVHVLHISVNIESAKLFRILKVAFKGKG